MVFVPYLIRTDAQVVIHLARSNYFEKYTLFKLWLIKHSLVKLYELSES
jgi:hypothetical protein